MKIPIHPEVSCLFVNLYFRNIHSFLGIMNLTGDWIILDTDFLAKLHRTNHFCFLLEELGRKFNFKFEYFVIKEQNILQMYQVVVRLKTYPGKIIRKYKKFLPENNIYLPMKYFKSLLYTEWAEQ